MSAPSRNAAPRAARLTERQIEALFVQLAEAMQSGLGLLQYLENPAVSSVLPGAVAASLSRDLRAGSTVATAFARLKILNRGELAMIRAAERVGSYPETFRSLAQAREARRKDRGKLLMGLAYPALLVGVAGCVLPLPLVVTEGFASYLSLAVWSPLFVLSAVVYVLLVVPRLRADSPMRRLPRRLGFAFPVLGKFLARGTHGTFAEVLGKTIAAGLPIQQCLQAAVFASDNPTIIAREERLYEVIGAGGTLVDAIKALDVFTPAFVGRVAQGEITGTLDEGLLRLAESERVVARRAVMTAISVTIAGVVLVVVVMIVGGIVRGAQGYFKTIDQVIEVQGQ